MSDEPLDRRILREIRDRLKESRAAVQEYERLQAALSALDDTSAATTTRAPSRARRRTTTSTQPRARRGANREKALQVIADRPGVTVAELASATGIAKNVVYSLTRTLTQQGRIERVELPGDSIGFRITEATEESTGANGAASDSAPTPKRTRRGRRTAGPTVETSDAPKASRDDAPATDAAATPA